MLSPIRQHAKVREQSLKPIVDQLAKLLERPQRPVPQTWSPTSDVITPPCVPIPISPITPVPAGVELIPATRLSLITTTTYNTGEINHMTMTQEDKQASEQEYQAPDQESLYPLIRELQEKLQAYQSDHNQRFPVKVRMPMNKLIPLHSGGIVEIIFRLAETSIIVEPDPKAKDAIQCCDG